MTGNMYGCFWTLRATPIFDFSWDSYECRCVNDDLTGYNGDDKYFVQDSEDGSNCQFSGACPH